MVMIIMTKTILAGYSSVRGNTPYIRTDSSRIYKHKIINEWIIRIVKIGEELNDKISLTVKMHIQKELQNKPAAGLNCDICGFYLQEQC